MTGKTDTSSVNSAQREFLTGSVVIAAIVLFIWTGGTAMTAVVNHFTGAGPSIEQVLMTAVLLNIALILFGWRRYRDLQLEVGLRREAEEQARSLADTDPLTGLLNRRALGERGAALLEEVHAKDQTIAMLILDLDNFKQINDVYGHAAGDQVLSTAAARLKAQMPSSALLARMGGDEFACAILMDPKSPGAIDRLAENLVAAMTDPITDNGLYLRTSTSIGIAQSHPDNETMSALMRRADIAMYCAKKQGRNCYAWFDSAVERELSTREMLESDMRTGLPRGEFTPYFEPQFRLSDGRLTGFEILARWLHPTQGVIMPEIFIPIAEKANLVGEVSLAVLRRALDEAVGWDGSLSLSINISPVQMRDPWMSQKFQKLLVETGFPASRLDVEFTEASLLQNMGLAQETIISLKNLGIRVVLDNFGTGYSSLSHLRALPLDRLKISRSFVTAMTRDEEKASTIDTIMKVSESLNLPVTAVGIEDEDILSRLRELSCFSGQGYHLGKAMPVEKTRKLLAERGLLIEPNSQDDQLDPANKRFAI